MPSPPWSFFESSALLEETRSSPGNGSAQIAPAVRLQDMFVPVSSS
jgi:hypothetical protein